MAKLPVCCPHCSTRLLIEESLLGRNARCRRCQKVFTLAAEKTAKNPVASAADAPRPAPTPEDASPALASRKTTSARTPQNVPSKPTASPPNAARPVAPKPTDPRRSAPSSVVPEANAATLSPPKGTPPKPNAPRPVTEGSTPAAVSADDPFNPFATGNSAANDPFAGGFGDLSNLDDILAEQERISPITPSAPPMESGFGGGTGRSNSSGRGKKTSGRHQRNRYGFTLDDLIERRNAFLTPFVTIIGLLLFCALLNMTVMRATPYYVAPAGLILFGVYIFSLIRYVRMTRAIWGGGGAVLAAINYLIPFPFSVLGLLGTFMLVCLGERSFGEFLLLSLILIGPSLIVLWSLWAAGREPKPYVKSNLEKRFGITPTFLWGILGFLGFLLAGVIFIGIMAWHDSASMNSDAKESKAELKVKEPIFGYRSMKAKEAEKWGNQFVGRLNEGKGWEAFETLGDDVYALYAADLYCHEIRRDKEDDPEMIYSLAKVMIKRSGNNIFKLRESFGRVKFLSVAAVGQTNEIRIMIYPKEWPLGDAKGIALRFVKKRREDPVLGSFDYLDSYSPEMNELEVEKANEERKMKEKEFKQRALRTQNLESGMTAVYPTNPDNAPSDRAPEADQMVIPAERTPIDVSDFNPEPRKRMEAVRELSGHFPSDLGTASVRFFAAVTPEGDRVEIARLNDVPPELLDKAAAADVNGDGYLDSAELDAFPRVKEDDNDDFFSRGLREGGIETAKITLPISLRGLVMINKAMAPDGERIDLSKLKRGDTQNNIKRIRGFDADADGFLDESEIQAFDESEKNRRHSGGRTDLSPGPNGVPKNRHKWSMQITNGQAVLTVDEDGKEHSISFDTGRFDLAKIREDKFPDDVIQALEEKDVNQDGLISRDELF